MSILPIIAMLLLGSLGIKLFLQGNLTLYIHPRYVVFAVIMNVICLAAALIALIVYAAQKEARAIPKRPSMLTLGVIALCLLALLAPPSPLQSSLVDKRYTIPQTDTAADQCNEPPADSATLSFQDWDALLSNCTNPELYKNTPVNLTGFVYEGQGISTTTVFPLARFVVSCCAIDAQPLIMLVKESGWANKYKVDDWVSVRGYMEVETVNGQRRAVIIPISVQKISQPKSPYEFIGQ